MILKIAPLAGSPSWTFAPEGRDFKLITFNMAITIESEGKDRKNFLTLYSQPLSFNVIYWMTLHLYSHLPVCSMIPDLTKSFRQLYIVGMVVPIAPDTSV